MRNYETTPRGNKEAEAETSDIFCRLQNKRILFLTDELNSDKASMLCAQMMMLDMAEHNRDIVLFINSEGGPLTDMLAIYDMMQAVKSDVMTICIGEASSAAALILSGGTKGKRYAFPHARLMIHQPQDGIEGSTRDVEIEAAELIHQRQQLYRIFERHTGQDLETLHKVMDRDTYMSASQARDFGLIDQVITKLPDFT